MLTKFDFLRTDPQFVSFADTAIAAEQTYNISHVLSVLGCRQAMEIAEERGVGFDGIVI